MISEACVYLNLLFLLQLDSLNERAREKRAEGEREREREREGEKIEQKSERERNVDTYQIRMRAIYFF